MTYGLVWWAGCSGFGAVHTLAPGETKAVHVTLTAAQLAGWDEKGSRFTVEEGPLCVLAGVSSTDIRQETLLTAGR